MVLHFAVGKSNQKGERQKVGLAEVKKQQLGQHNTEEQGGTSPTRKERSLVS